MDAPAGEQETSTAALEEEEMTVLVLQMKKWSIKEN